MACDEVRRRGHCPFCSNRRLSVTNSLAALRPDLAREWHPTRNGRRTPGDVVATSSKTRVWWKCPRGPDHAWHVAPFWRVRFGFGCPFCAGQQPSVTSSLATRYPDVAAQWHPTRNGELTPHDISPAAKRIIWWRCSRGHAWQESPRARTTPSSSACPRCVPKPRRSGQGRPTLRGQPVRLLASYPHLVAQWDPTRNGGLKPTDFTAGSSKPIWWRCTQGPDHTWQAAPRDRTKGIGCPFCAGVRVSAGNSLAAIASPHVVAQWHPTRNRKVTPSMVGAGSNKKYWWRCDKGHVWKTAARNRALYGTGCPRCVKRGGAHREKLPPRVRAHAPSHQLRRENAQLRTT